MSSAIAINPKANTSKKAAPNTFSQTQHKDSRGWLLLPEGGGHECASGFGREPSAGGGLGRVIVHPETTATLVDGV